MLAALISLDCCKQCAAKLPVGIFSRLSSRFLGCRKSGRVAVTNNLAAAAAAAVVVTFPAVTKAAASAAATALWQLRPSVAAVDAVVVV